MTTRGKRGGTVARFQAYSARLRGDLQLTAWFERMRTQAPSEPRSPAPTPEQTELFTGLPVTPVRISWSVRGPLRAGLAAPQYEATETARPRAGQGDRV